MTIFEEDPKEYAEGMAKYYESAHGSVPSQFEKYLRKAVEYGYNKANEWHYVKDGLPKESKKYYVYSEEWGVEIRKFIADADCFECRNNIIIAWKEIVLPKLPKESE